MKKGYKITVIILLIIIVLGFAIGFLIPEIWACTALGCPCTNIEGERECNSCDISNYIFVTGVINLVNSCDGQEILSCSNNEQVGKRIDKNNCGYELRFFFQGI
tara:strand:+ start:1452 stop:1763 length:312 start_codon:yes stop_codon:yes gene_type:complete